MENREWGTGNGEQGMGNRKWGTGNGEWEIENVFFLLFRSEFLIIFYTPHCLHSSFSTLRIFHTLHFPHSTFHPPHPTLLIFYTPHPAYSSEPDQNGGWKLVGKNVHRKRYNFRRQPENVAFKVGKIAKISKPIMFSFLKIYISVMCGNALLTMLFTRKSFDTTKRTKKSLVSTANKPLAGTLITIGDVKTVSTARKISQITPTMALSFWPRSITHIKFCKFFEHVKWHIAPWNWREIPVTP